METSVKAPLSDALNQLWMKFLPQMEERLSALDTANRALSAGSLSDEERLEAVGAAHKLAGVLGTFGLAEGTQLAREAELAYSGDLAALSDNLGRLQAIARELSQMIRNR
ncbi:MAG TPA: Hpt domain-containing protein [Terracidiphilus sp.]|jgi:HPt (histidine-containing phosphotransfer) domain-containing protein